MVLMTPHNHITAFTTNPLEGLSPLTASSSVTSALQFSATRFLNAIIAASVSLFNVIPLYPDELMNLALSHLPRFLGSLPQNFAPHDVLMSVLLTAVHVTHSSGIVRELAVEFGLRNYWSIAINGLLEKSSLLFFDTW